MPLVYRQIEVPQQQVAGFVCDRCKAEYDAENFVETQEMLHWKNTGGYGAIWGDGTTVEVTLCQRCTHDLFKDFAQVTEEGAPS